MLSKEKRQRDQQLLMPLALKAKPRHLSPLAHRRHKSAMKSPRKELLSSALANRYPSSSKTRIAQRGFGYKAPPDTSEELQIMKFRDLYAQLQERVGKLEKLTQFYLQKGPPALFKEQLRKATLVASHALSQFPMRTGFIPRTIELNGILKIILRRCNKELKNLLAKHPRKPATSLQKLLNHTSPSFYPNNDSLIFPTTSSQDSQDLSSLSPSKREFLSSLFRPDSIYLEEQPSKQMTDSEDTDGSLTFAPQQVKKEEFKLECFQNESLLFQKYLKKAGLLEYFVHSQIQNQDFYIYTLRATVPSESRENLITYADAFLYQSHRFDLNSAEDLNRMETELISVLKLYDDCSQFEIVDYILTVESFAGDVADALLRQLEHLFDNYSMFHFTIPCLYSCFFEHNIPLFPQIPLTYQKLDSEQIQLLYRCKAAQKPKWELILKTKLSSICAEQIAITDSALRLLTISDRLHPHLSLIRKLEIQHQCCIEIKDGEQHQEQELNLFEVEDPELEEETKDSLHLTSDSSHLCNHLVVITALNKEKALQIKNSLKHRLWKFDSARLTIAYSELCFQIADLSQKPSVLLQIERRLNVVVNLSPDAGVQIYGSEESQNLARIELTHTSLGRYSLKLPQLLRIIMREKEFNVLRKSVKSQFPSAQLFFWSNFVIYYCEERDQEDVHKLLIHLVGELSNRIVYKVFSAHYSCFLDELLQFQIAHHNAANILENNSLDPIVREIPKHVSQGEWSYRDQDMQEYMVYAEEINTEIEKRYQKGEQFFEIDESSFSLAKSREQTWQQNSDKGRYCVKRETKWRRLNQMEEVALQSHEIMVTGFAQQVSEIELFFNSQTKEVISIPLPKSAIKLSLDCLIHTGRKFGSAVILNGNEIQLVGKWKEVIAQDIKAMLRKSADDGGVGWSEKEFSKLIRRRWKNAPALTVERIEDKEGEAKYKRNRKIRETKSIPLKEEILFQLGEPDSVHDYERELKNFKEALLEERDVIAYSVLVDNVVEVDDQRIGPRKKESGFYEGVIRKEEGGMVYSITDRSLVVGVFKLKRRE